MPHGPHLLILPVLLPYSRRDGTATMLREARRLAEVTDTLVQRTGARQDDVRVVRSPLRICPLGAHVDHQLGKVTGLTLDEAVLLAFVPNTCGRVRLWSLDFDGAVEFALDDIGPPTPGQWGNYPRGAALVLRQAHDIQVGLDGVLSGPLPIGGLSSSAAVDVAYLLALETVNGLSVDAVENIRLAQQIENGYIGLNNGILDQSVILMAQPDALTCLDCLDQSFTAVPTPPTARFDLVVAYSGLSRSLVATDYNQRVAECQAAAAELLRLGGLDVPESPRLRHVPPEVYEEYVDRLEDKPARRARHFFGEVERVDRGARAWAEGDLEQVGRLMVESGASSIANYECGSPHTITLYEILNGVPGVYGSRFSGAGFRGACVALADPEARERVAAAVGEAYPAQHPDIAATYSLHFCSPSGPAEVW